MLGFSAIAANRRRGGGLVNSVLPRFVDVNGNAIVNPMPGEDLFLDPGAFSGSPSSYDFQVYSGSTPIFGVSGVWLPGEPIYNVLDDQLGIALKVGVIAHAGGNNSEETFSTPTAAVADPVITPPVFARTTPSGTNPMGFTITVDGTVRSGPRWQFRLVVADDSSLDDSVTTQELFKEITSDELTGPSFLSNWDGTFDPQPQPAPLAAYSATSVLAVEVVYRTPEGRVIASGLSNMLTPTGAVGFAFDPFSSNVRDPLKWDATDLVFIPGETQRGTIQQTNGELQVQPTTGLRGYNFRRSKNAASFIGKYVGFRRSTSGGSVSVHSTLLRIGQDLNSGYGIMITGSIQLIGYPGSGASDNVGAAFADPDYASSGAPATCRWIRIRHDYVAGVTDDIVVETAPSSASYPPAPGDWTVRIRVARNDAYWNKTTNPSMYMALGGGQWSDGFPVLLPIRYADAITDMFP